MECRPVNEAQVRAVERRMLQTLERLATKKKQRVWIARQRDPSLPVCACVVVTSYPFLHKYIQ